MKELHNIQIDVTATGAMNRRHEPLTCGIPLPKSFLIDPQVLQLADYNGQIVPLQSKILDRWSDGSIRWLLLDWQADIQKTTRYELTVDQKRTELNSPLRVKQSGTQATIDTRAGVFRFEKGQRDRLFTFTNSSADQSRESIDAQFIVEDVQGTRYQPAIERIELEESGPLRTCILLNGKLVSAPTRAFLADWIIRLHFFAGLTTVRAHITIRNPRKAEHPGGLWDLGNGGSIYLRDASIVLACPSSDQTWNGQLSWKLQQPFQKFQGHCLLYQDSSGGDNWKSGNHINRHRQVPHTFRGFRLTMEGKHYQGTRATPAIMIQRDNQQVGLAMPAFWQNFPKAIEVAENRLILRLLPRQSADVHELQGGEQKTHVCYLAFGPDSVTQEPLEWCRAPTHAYCTAEWYGQCQAVPFLTPRGNDPHTDYLRLVDAAIEGTDTFEKKREVIDEYGWRHFGDIYGDHEAVLHQGTTPLISHYNNQYDAIAGMGIQYLRSCDLRWLQMMHELAEHVMDIDIYHTDQDKSAYNHGLFWHTFHYVDADTGTHRSYPTHGKVPPDEHPVPGGGPANEQNYASGLMLHFFLTGNAAAREAAIGLAQWVIDMDDGRKTVFRWLSRQFTGLASQSGTPRFHGPGRGAANSISALLDGHRLSSEERFLDKAEQLIRRCIHPDDDIEKRNLLDAENRWFYTMFLQVLGKYLFYKAEQGEFDQYYAYARESLLHYARWMLEHEYPYLTKPENLEYPTETWAAQDMRKSEIFKLAALCSDGIERQHFIEHSEFFFNYSVDTLHLMPTRALCRPVVLMLNFGHMHAWYKQHPEASLPQLISENRDFGSPMVFVPQKSIAIRRAKLIIVAGAGLLLTVMIILAYLLFS